MHLSSFIDAIPGTSYILSTSVSRSLRKFPALCYQIAHDVHGAEINLSVLPVSAKQINAFLRGEVPATLGSSAAVVLRSL